MEIDIFLINAKAEKFEASAIEVWINFEKKY